MQTQIKTTLTKKQRLRIEKLRATGQVAEAQAKLVDICQQSPRNVDAWLLLADLCQKINDRANAITCFNKVIQIETNNVIARKKLSLIYSAMAQSSIECADKAKAKTEYTHALNIDPDNIQALSGLAALLIDIGEELQSIPYLEKAATLLPNNAAIYYLLGLAYEKTTGIERGSSHYINAHELEPDNSRYRLSYARILNFNGEYTAAEHILEELIKTDAENVTIITELLLAYANTGKAHEASTLIKPFIERPVNDIPYKIIIRYLEVCKKLSTCDDAAKLAQSMLQNTHVSTNELYGAYFLLGKYFDEKEDYETAFEYFSAGNKIKDNNSAAHKQRLLEMQEMISLFDPQTLNAMPSLNKTTECPVFIVGMPRSGTSLVEQILTSHPSVFGTGEEFPLSQFVSSYLTSSGSQKKFPACMLDMTTDDLQAMSNQYLETIGKRTDSGEYLRITNKVPNNFKYLILINKLFPNAKIIHCKRHPLDNCISIFFQTFAGTHAYAYNLEKLAAYYNTYNSLMEHYTNNLGIPMFHIQYEDLVNDQEYWSRKLVEHCNLDWNEACLRFYNNKRTVKTASQDQVIRPVYHSSINRWRNYEHHLGSLVASLNTSNHT